MRSRWRSSQLVLGIRAGSRPGPARREPSRPGPAAGAELGLVEAVQCWSRRARSGVLVTVRNCWNLKIPANVQWRNERGSLGLLELLHSALEMRWQ